ncbi:hypothetical protein [Flammeovirga aprica]|uniref:Uncharacterized protein n=1 Tax=Flammeovirga aprica JL-4 TaxID=694437 RepID=A0A7X9XDD7_9BACT|nr:hypothetical protein [Flammeovirga aprica]NME72539.1 hypothetical protein [Flammeovirga aprica JL-4]
MKKGFKVFIHNRETGIADVQHFDSWYSAKKHYFEKSWSNECRIENAYGKIVAENLTGTPV